MAALQKAGIHVVEFLPIWRGSKSVKGRQIVDVRCRSGTKKLGKAKPRTRTPVGDATGKHPPEI